MKIVSSFALSGAAATLNVSTVPVTLPMPAPAAGAPDLIVTNTGAGAAWISFAAAAPVGPGTPGNVSIQAGATILLSETAAAGVRAQAGVYATASAVTVVGAAPTSLTVQRGLATDMRLFEATVL